MLKKSVDLGAKISCAVLIALTLGSFVLGQTGTASVNGTIQDAQGNLVAGATVTLANANRGFSRTTVAASNGTFSFTVVPPGTYELTVESGGFKKFVKSNLVLVVDTPSTVNVSLEVGAVTETVTVVSNTADALINTQDATVGNTFVAQQVTQLPTEARNVVSLLSLQPGVTRDGYVAGARSDQSNVTLDGVDINEAQNNDISGPVLRLNAEAIEEFRVTTTTANSSQGRSSGAQVSLITKGGTNQFRGALFLTGRRTGWTANNFFNNRSGIDREKFDRNVFGGAIGGPIVRNRLFFFYSYEGERTTRGASYVRVVPLATLGQGTVRFRNDSGAVVSINCADIATIFPATLGCNNVGLTALAAAAARYTANADEGGGDGLNTGGYRFNADSEIKGNSHVGRFDYNITSRMSAFFRTNIIYDTSTGEPQFQDTAAPTLWNHPWGLVAGHSWTINNRLINNFRYGLTRDAFSQQGDSAENNISFRFVFSPNRFVRTISRVTPVQNFTDDLTYIWNNHTFQIGTNIRLINNQRQTFASAFDSAVTNPSFYPGGGTSVTNPINTFLSNNRGYTIGSGSVSNVQNAVTAAIGRYTQYAANFTFLRNGNLTASGTPSDREFKTEEYDFYVQDIWRAKPNLTFTFGLRYGISLPVTETSGYEVKPNIPLGELFRQREAAAAAGNAFNQAIVLDLSGKANGRSPLYKTDKNNFQPRLSMAWSPDFGDNFFGRMFGRNNESVIRGGFGIFNDYYGQAIAVRFDLNNTLGFSSSSQIPANFYNLTTRVGPQFTSYTQNIRTLPNLTIPAGTLTFPRQAPNRTYPTAIEGGLDEDLITPINYNWSLTYERKLKGGFLVSASYLGRKARNLLQSRDAAAITNFRDPVSGTDWYTAAGQLELLRSQAVPVSQIPQIPYFTNIFPANLVALLGYCPGSSTYNPTQAVYSMMVPESLGGCSDQFTNYGNDWTSAQLELSTFSSRFPGQHIFYQQQYGTLGAFSTIGVSDYHALTISARQRLSDHLTMDFNYTLSQSKDEGSGLQSGAVTSGAGFVLNPFRQRDMYALSDFDMKHIINMNAIWQLPFGRGRAWFGGIGKAADLLIGGWQMTGIFRYNSGRPISAPYDDARWATNWNVQSYGTRIADVSPCPVRGGAYFGCNTTQAYRSFRNARPGETGERNVFRLPGFWTLDMGLGKAFNMPWSEGHKLQFRWEVFNVANYQAMGSIDTSRSGYGIPLDPARRAANPPSNFSQFTGIQGNPRSMQYVLRYSF